ncbi:VanZ family protein [Winogradskyella sp. UBA3174]|uniref:VanZ family protein n=1 Tax=Winogradskyella sp. UBA3174 TaxID=1947785 RepID=UPI0025FE4C00|nr:VanZ family protein [Winogradskyella sp. UBA3174]
MIVSFINLYNVPKIGSGHDDKIYHVLAYSILAFLWMTYFKSSNKPHIILSVIVSTVFFGLVIEILQHQLNSNRTFDVLDILANCVGVLIGTLIAVRLYIYKLK